MECLQLADQVSQARTSRERGQEVVLVQREQRALVSVEPLVERLPVVLRQARGLECLGGGKCACDVGRLVIRDRCRAAKYEDADFLAG